MPAQRYEIKSIIALQVPDGMVTDFDPMLWVSLVDFATVFSKGDVRIILRTAPKYRA